MNHKQDNDFHYCKGIGCPLAERCARYVEGQPLPEGDWSWQYGCGDEQQGFLPVS